MPLDEDDIEALREQGFEEEDLVRFQESPFQQPALEQDIAPELPDIPPQMMPEGMPQLAQRAVPAQPQVPGIGDIESALAAAFPMEAPSEPAVADHVEYNQQIDPQRSSQVDVRALPEIDPASTKTEDPNAKLYQLLANDPSDLASQGFRSAVQDLRGEEVQNQLWDMSEDPLLNALGGTKRKGQKSGRTPRSGRGSGRGCGNGGGGGKSMKGKVLCTYAHEQGYISDAVIDADYARAEYESIHTKNGYWSWAVPLTSWFEKHPTLFKYTIKPFVVAWARQMAYREGVLKKPNVIGLLLESLGKPICFSVGLLIKLFKIKI